MEYVNRTKQHGTMVLTSHLAPSSKWLQASGLFKLLWVRKGCVTVDVDHTTLQLEADTLLPLMPDHRLTIVKTDGEYVAILFNQQFYSIYRNDRETASHGMLFKGSAVPHLHLMPEQTARLESILHLLQTETGINDRLQEEAIRLLLKHLIITCTRITREQMPESRLSDPTYELIRRYHVLVDLHYKEKKRVHDYALLLGRSPKTLANIFALCGVTPPLRVIHERINAEAKRLLLFTNLSTGQISDALGYEDASSFVRFFKNMNDETTLKYRRRLRGRWAPADSPEGE